MKLFVIEGVDGSGKSTQLKLLNDYFAAKGYSCELLHFPRTSSPYFGELIARFLRGEFGSIGDVDPYLVAMLFAGDRMDASGMIRNWLNEGRIVLLDRYTYSNIAYQCAKLDDPDSREKLINWILSLEFNHFGIPTPDLNIFLDVPFSFTERELSSGRRGIDRDYLKGSPDIHEENLIFQKKVRDIYLRVSLGYKLLAVIDCSDNRDIIRAPEEISSLIIQTINERKLI